MVFSCIFGQCVEVGNMGHSEPTTTNAPFGCFVHWMGCVFSFSAKWGSTQSIFIFFVDHCALFYLFLVLGRFFPWT
jgi:hypothetical protein